MRRSALNTDGMVQEYRESLLVGAPGSGLPQFLSRHGYIRHAQNTTAWETALGVLGLMGLLYVIGRLFIAHIGPLI